MYIAMNHFKVTPGREGEFEESWRNRRSYLQEVPGFIQFSLLKREGDGGYASHTVWESKEAFVAWTESPAFAAGHRQGSVAGVLMGPPQVELWDAIMVQEKVAEAGKV